MNLANNDFHSERNLASQPVDDFIIYQALRKKGDPVPQLAMAFHKTDDKKQYPFWVRNPELLEEKKKRKAQSNDKSMALLESERNLMQAFGCDMQGDAHMQVTPQQSIQRPTASDRDSAHVQYADVNYRKPAAPTSLQQTAQRSVQPSALSNNGFGSSRQAGAYQLRPADPESLQQTAQRQAWMSRNPAHSPPASVSTVDGRMGHNQAVCRSPQTYAREQKMSQQDVQRLAASNGEHEFVQRIGSPYSAPATPTSQQHVATQQALMPRNPTLSPPTSMAVSGGENTLVQTPGHSMPAYASEQKAWQPNVQRPVTVSSGLRSVQRAGDLNSAPAASVSQQQIAEQQALINRNAALLGSPSDWQSRPPLVTPEQLARAKAFGTAGPVPRADDKQVPCFAANPQQLAQPHGTASRNQPTHPPPGTNHPHFPAPTILQYSAQARPFQAIASVNARQKQTVQAPTTMRQRFRNQGGPSAIGIPRFEMGEKELGNQGIKGVVARQTAAAKARPGLQGQ